MKSKQLYSFLIVMFMIFSMFLSTSGIVLASSMEGAGTETSPYLIRTVENLYDIPKNPTSHYRLMNDLDLQNLERYPMETFMGVFDGNNKTISNLKLISPAGYIGLFSTTSDAIFKNLKSKNAHLESG